MCWPRCCTKSRSWRGSDRDESITLLLLIYVGANGVEDERQRTPANAVEIAQMLLDAGAEVDAEADLYGGGVTTLGPAATSVHPERAGVQNAVLKFLIDRGANLDHPSAGGNRHGDRAPGARAGTSSRICGGGRSDAGFGSGGGSGAAGFRAKILQLRWGFNGRCYQGTDAARLLMGL